MKNYKFITDEGKIISIKSNMNEKQWNHLNKWLEKQEDETESNIKNEIKKFNDLVKIEIIK